jgi:hypothetical protein
VGLIFSELPPAVVDCSSVSGVCCTVGVTDTLSWGGGVDLKLGADFVTKLVTVVLLEMYEITTACVVEGCIGPGFAVAVNVSKAVVNRGAVVNSGVAVIVSDRLRHGCNGSEDVDCGYIWVGWKAVAFPYTVTTCVVVDTLNLKEVAVAQYDTQLLPVVSSRVFGWHRVSVVDVELEVARQDVVEGVVELVVKVIVELVVKVVLEFLAEVVENGDVIDDEIFDKEVVDEDRE